MSLEQKIIDLAKTIATNQVAQDIENNQKFATKTELTSGLVEKVNVSDAFTEEKANTLYLPLDGKASSATVADSALSVEWENVSNKPLTFAPSAHTHEISDVNGLQLALDEKQPSGDYATNSALNNGLAGKLGKTEKAESASVADSVAWTGVTGKPSSFTPSAHTHTIANVDGLQDKISSIESRLLALESAGYITADDLPRTADFVD